MNHLEESLQYSAWQKKSVPTFKISQEFGKGGGRLSLQEIMDRVPPFSCVILPGGQYLEQLSINKPVELCGDEADEPVLMSRGPTLTVFGDVPCYFSHLKIKVRSLIAASVQRSEPPSVLVNNGSPTFFRCEMSSILVTGSATPYVERCLIVGNQSGSGIMVKDSAGGSYINNEITDHSLYCIDCSSRGEAVFGNNDVHLRTDNPMEQGGAGLVRISGSSIAVDEVSPVFKDNRFQDTVDATTGLGSIKSKKTITAIDMLKERTIVAVENASPTFEGNFIEGGIVSVSLVNSKGLFRGNSIVKSLLCAAFLFKNSGTQFETTRISDHKGGGVFMDGSAPSFKECAIVSCGGPGVTARHCEHISFENCSIERNKCGFISTEGCFGIVKGTVVSHNTLFGMRLDHPACGLKLFKTQVHVNGAAGVVCRFGASPKIDECEISGHTVGLLVETGSRPTVSNSNIKENTQVSVSISQNSRGTFTQNVLKGGDIAVVKVFEGSNPLFKNNKIESSKVGILATDGGIGEFQGNTVTGHMNGFVVSNFADPYITENQIAACTHNGILVLSEGIGTFVNNEIDQCQVGVQVTTGGEPAFRGNNIHACCHAGALLGEGSRAVFEKNKFTLSDSHNIHLTGNDSENLIVCNEISGAAAMGVQSDHGATGTVCRNTFTGNAEGGYGTSDNGNTMFERNTSTSERGPAIHCKSNGKGVFRHNIIREGETSGCLVNTGALPQIEDCTFEHNHLYGIEIRDGALGEIKNCNTSGNGRSGVFFTGSAKTQVTNLHAHGNSQEGVLISDGASCTLLDSLVEKQDVGIRTSKAGPAMVRGVRFLGNRVGSLTEMGGDATLEECHFEDSEVSHVELKDSGNILLKKCTFGPSKKTAVHAHRKCRGEISGCDFANCTEMAILIEDEGAPRIVKCKIHHNAVGVVARRRGAGVVEECEVFENLHTNIHCMSQSTTHVLSCVISKCTEGPGVQLEADAARVEKNEIVENFGDGVEVLKNSRAKCVGNQIHHNGNTGVFAHSHSDAIFEDGAIFRNASAGVALGPHSSTKIVGCEVMNNKECGVTCLTRSMGKVDKSNIHDNANSNVRVLFSSNTHFIANQIAHSEVGVLVEGGSNRFDSNTIEQHRDFGVYVTGPSRVDFSKNFIFNNSLGVCVEADGENKYAIVPVTVGEEDWRAKTASAFITTDHDEQKSVSPPRSRRGSVVNIDAPDMHSGKKQAHSTASTALFQHNEIKLNKIAGVRVHAGGAPHLFANIFSSEKIGVSLLTDACGFIDKNTFTANVIGLDVHGKGIATKVERNAFEGNDTGVACRGNSSAVLRRRSSGILLQVSDHATTEEKKVRTTFKENSFKKNKKAGLSVTEGSDTVVQECLFDTDIVGVSVTEDAAPTIQSCRFAHCDVGVHLHESTNSQISRNEFITFTEVGVLVTGGISSMRGNIFAECCVAGIVVDGESGSPTVSHNVFARNNGSELAAGVYTKNGGGGVFSWNDMHENGTAIRSDSRGAGTFTNCFLHDNVFGVNASGSGRPEITRSVFQENSVADVFTHVGGCPNVSKCLMKNSVVGVQSVNGGGGLISHNVIRQAQKQALLIELEELHVHEGNEEDGSYKLPTSLEVSRIKSPVSPFVSPFGDSPSAFASVHRSTLSSESNSNGAQLFFDSNLLLSCYIGVEIDCGTASTTKSTKSLSLGDSSKKPHAAKASMREYVSPLPDLASLGRVDYRVHVSNNVMTSCGVGIQCRNGPEGAPPKLDMCVSSPRQSVLNTSDLAVAPSFAFGNSSGFNPDDESGLDGSDAASSGLKIKPNDDCHMVLCKGNTISGSDWGILLQRGGNACFHENHISKCNRGGICVDHSRGEFLRNVVAECLSVGIVLQGHICYANLQSNVFYNSRINMSFNVPEPRVYRNYFVGGDTGIVVGEHAKAIIDHNYVYNNKRTGVSCGSDTILFVTNMFYSANERGAFETTADGFTLPNGNMVKNQFAPRYQRPEPAKKMVLGADVSESAIAKMEKELFSVLRDIHEKELPSHSAHIGCSKISKDNTIQASIIARKNSQKRNMETAFIEMGKVKPRKSVLVMKTEETQEDDNDGIQAVMNIAEISKGQSGQRKKNRGVKRVSKQKAETVGNQEEAPPVVKNVKRKTGKTSAVKTDKVDIPKEQQISDQGGHERDETPNSDTQADIIQEPFPCEENATSEIHTSDQLDVESSPRTATPDRSSAHDASASHHHLPLFAAHDDSQMIVTGYHVEGGDHSPVRSHRSSFIGDHSSCHESSPHTRERRGTTGADHSASVKTYFFQLEASGDRLDLKRREGGALDADAKKTFDYSHVTQQGSTHTLVRHASKSGDEFSGLTGQRMMVKSRSQSPQTSSPRLNTGAKSPLVSTFSPGSPKMGKLLLEKIHAAGKTRKGRTQSLAPHSFSAISARDTASSPGAEHVDQTNQSEKCRSVSPSLKDADSPMAPPGTHGTEAQNCSPGKRPASSSSFDMTPIDKVGGQSRGSSRDGVRTTPVVTTGLVKLAKLMHETNNDEGDVLQHRMIKELEESKLKQSRFPPAPSVRAPHAAPPPRTQRQSAAERRAEINKRMRVKAEEIEEEFGLAEVKKGPWKSDRKKSTAAHFTSPHPPKNDFLPRLALASAPSSEQGKSTFRRLTIGGSTISPPSGPDRASTSHVPTRRVTVATTSPSEEMGLDCSPANSIRVSRLSSSAFVDQSVSTFPKKKAEGKEGKSVLRPIHEEEEQIVSGSFLSPKVKRRPHLSARPSPIGEFKCSGALEKFVPYAMLVDNLALMSMQSASETN